MRVDTFPIAVYFDKKGYYLSCPACSNHIHLTPKQKEDIGSTWLVKCRKCKAYYGDEHTIELLTNNKSFNGKTGRFRTND